MKDYNTYYQSKYSQLKEELQQRFAIEVTQAPDSTIDLKMEFLEKVQFEKNNIVKNYDPNLPGASDYILTKNLFKELIIKEFG